MDRCAKCGRLAEARNRLSICARCAYGPVTDLGDPDDLNPMTSVFDEPWPGHDDWLTRKHLDETGTPDP